MTRWSLQPCVYTRLCLNTAVSFLRRPPSSASHHLVFVFHLFHFHCYSISPLSLLSFLMSMSRLSSFQFSALIRFHTSTCPPLLPHLSLPLQQQSPLCLISFTLVLCSDFSALSSSHVSCCHPCNIFQ